MREGPIPLNNHDDAALARQWRAGDREAVAVAAERFSKTLGAVAYAALGDHALAEDVVQETFARAHRVIRTLKEDGKLASFLTGIARNIAMDTLRKRGRERPLEFDGRAASGTPESDAIRAELRERLRVAVARLEPDQREVFLLKYQAGLGYADIARSLSTTPEAISQKLWRIRKKLQLELREFKP